MSILQRSKTSKARSFTARCRYYAFNDLRKRTDL